MVAPLEEVMGHGHFDSWDARGVVECSSEWPRHFFVRDRLIIICVTSSVSVINNTA